MTVNLSDLLRQLGENLWPDRTDVEIMVDDGSGKVYTLDAVYDHGNHIVLVGDRGSAAHDSEKSS